MPLSLDSETSLPELRKEVNGTMVLVPFREADVRFFDDPIHFLFESLDPLMPRALPAARFSSR